MQHIRHSIESAYSKAEAFDPGIPAESSKQNVAAAQYVIQLIHEPQLIIAQREAKMKLLQKASRSMQPATDRARAVIKPINYPVAKRINSGLLFIMALATSYPDADIATDLIVGISSGKCASTGVLAAPGRRSRCMSRRAASCSQVGLCPSSL